jgi:hypothetical protein
MATNQAIEALKKGFSDANVVLPGTEDFNILNSSYLSKAQGEIQPIAIFLPETRDDVAKFVRLIAPFALKGTVQFAVRGGGQQPALGCNNIDGGITIDLRKLTGIELSGDGDSNTTVSIGAGERWGAVYATLQEKGLGVTGGRSASNGIGGLSLSGECLPLRRIASFSVADSVLPRWPLLLLFSRGVHH